MLVGSTMSQYRRPDLCVASTRDRHLPLFCMSRISNRRIDLLHPFVNLIGSQ